MVSWRFFGTGGRRNEVTLEVSIDNLKDVFVGEVDDQAALLRDKRSDISY
jgi:hypothetical protein